MIERNRSVCWYVISDLNILLLNFRGKVLGGFSANVLRCLRWWRNEETLVERHRYSPLHKTSIGLRYHDHHQVLLAFFPSTPHICEISPKRVTYVWPSGYQVKPCVERKQKWWVKTTREKTRTWATLFSGLQVKVSFSPQTSFFVANPSLQQFFSHHHFEFCSLKGKISFQSEGLSKSLIKKQKSKFKKQSFNQQ